MRIEREFLRSGIVRRLVTCFLVVAFLPLGATAISSLEFVSNLLLEQSRVRLALAADDYTAALHDRLLAVDVRLHELTRRGDLAVLSRNGNGNTDRLKAEFRALAIVDDSGRVKAIYGDITHAPIPNAMQAQRLARGDTVLSSVGDARSTPRLFASARLAGTPAPARRVVAEIDPAYLWRRPADSPARTVICVGDGLGRLLSCPQEAAPGELHELALRANEGASSFAHDDVTYLASHRTLMLEPEYADRNWSVVAMELESDALAPMAGLESLLFAITGIAMLMVVVVSLTQVSGILRPLDALREVVRRVTEKDFSARVDAAGNRDLAALAQSFNTMAARLGGEFTALMTLADIDQAILSRLDLDRVIETVVMRMREVVPADYVSVAIVDRNAPAMVRIYTRDQSREGGLELERCAFSRSDTEVLLAYPDGLWLDGAQAVTPYLRRS